MVKYLLLLIFISWSKSTFAQTQTTQVYTNPATTSKQVFICPFLPKCSCTEKELYCQNFNEFAELDFSNNKRPLVFNLIRLKPKRRQNLTETNLNLSGLKISPSGIVEISNIDWIFFRANPLKTLERAEKNHFTTILKLIDSKFRFMLDETRTLNSICGVDSTLFESVDETSLKSGKILLDHSLMSSVNTLELNSIDFVEPICPLVFNEVKISIMNVKDSVGSNQFRFLPMKINKPSRNVSHYKKLYEITGLGSFIRTITFDNIDLEQIDSNLVNLDVFSAVQFIAFRNVRVNKIEPNSFINFKYLNKLEMDLVNWKDLVDRNELQWMYDLNRYVQEVDMNKLSAYTDKKFIFYVDFNNYSLPEDDFCKFYYFPLKRYVVPYIKPDDTKSSGQKCNCVFAWLLQYHKSYPTDSEYAIWSGEWTNCTEELNSNGTCTNLADRDHCELYNPMSLHLRDAASKGGLFKSPVTIIVLVTLTALLLFTGGFFITRRLKRGQQSRGQSDDQEQQNVEATNFI